MGFDFACSGSMDLSIRMKAEIQIIERDGKPEWAVLPYGEYLPLGVGLTSISNCLAIRGKSCDEHAVLAPVSRSTLPRGDPAEK